MGVGVIFVVQMDMMAKMDEIAPSGFSKLLSMVSNLHYDLLQSKKFSAPAKAKRGRLKGYWDATFEETAKIRNREKRVQNTLTNRVE